MTGQADASAPRTGLEFTAADFTAPPSAFVTTYRN
jgi:hypothetical protein